MTVESAVIGGATKFPDECTNGPPCYRLPIVPVLTNFLIITFGEFRKDGMVLQSWIVLLVY